MADYVVMEEGNLEVFWQFWGRPSKEKNTISQVDDILDALSVGLVNEKAVYAWEPTANKPRNMINRYKILRNPPAFSEGTVLISI